MIINYVLLVSLFTALTLLLTLLTSLIFLLGGMGMQKNKIREDAKVCKMMVQQLGVEWCRVWHGIFKLDAEKLHKTVEQAIQESFQIWEWKGLNLY